jgi:hypothetical protein
MRAILFLLAVALTMPCLARDRPLGKLFLTPEKRQMLERQRQLNLRDTENMESETLQLDGVVLRSSGRSSVWTNQHMQDSRDGGIRVNPNRPGTATLDTDKSSSVQIQVGDSVNRSTQERKSLVTPDAVRAGKKP